VIWRPDRAEVTVHCASGTAPFWGTVQLELLDSRAWQMREDLANVIFEWIALVLYNLNCRHSSIGMHSPITFGTFHTRPDQDH
jgi:putative transposase